MKILLLNASPKNYGATQEILKILQAAIPAEHTSEIVCMGDYELRYCKGCMGCYVTGYCSIRDGMDELIEAAGAQPLRRLRAGGAMGAKGTGSNGKRCRQGGQNGDQGQVTLFFPQVASGHRRILILCKSQYGYSFRKTAG